ncbi:MAG: aminoacyl-tRNA hydrolase [Cytophagaceae bacterium]
MKYLICGLGNIGPEYELTRHNIGFLILDRLADRLEVKFEIGRHAYHAEAKFKGRVLILVKPTTFMNLSGKAFSHWMNSEKIPLENSIAITDDIALPFGKIRIKGKGSNGGHNGLGDIQSVLGTDVYPRMRIGVGNDYPKGRQAEYVLSRFPADEMGELPDLLDKCCDAVLSFVSIGMERTMNTFNTKG